ncbi:MAG: hypothetical protein ABIR18_03075, partial [Chitinophagaceae bacterium]
MKKNLKDASCFMSQLFSPGLKCCCCLILMMVLHLSVTAQSTTIKVSGKITSAPGDPLQDVTVAEKNTTNM